MICKNFKKQNPKGSSIHIKDEILKKLQWVKPIEYWSRKKRKFSEIIAGKVENKPINIFKRKLDKIINNAMEKS